VNFIPNSPNLQGQSVQMNQQYTDIFRGGVEDQQLEDVSVGTFSLRSLGTPISTSSSQMTSTSFMQNANVSDADKHMIIKCID